MSNESPASVLCGMANISYMYHNVKLMKIKYEMMMIIIIIVCLYSSTQRSVINLQNSSRQGALLQINYMPPLECNYVENRIFAIVKSLRGLVIGINNIILVYVTASTGV